MTYSSSLAVSRNRFSGRNRNSIALAAPKKRLGPVSNTIILIVLSCLLAMLYLTQVTKTNTYGYQINKLQSEAQQLQQQKDNLELASAQMQSLGRVQNSSVAKSMVAVTPASTVNH